MSSRSKTSLMVGALWLLAAAQAIAAPRVLAVLELTPGDGAVTPAMASFFSDVVRGAAANSLRGSGFTVVSKDIIEQVLSDLEKRGARCDLGSCDAEIAGNLGASHFVTGDILRVGQGLFVTLKLSRQSDNALLGSRQVRARDQESMVDALAEPSADLVRLLVEPPGAPPHAAAEAAAAPTPGVQAPAASRPPAGVPPLEDRVLGAVHTALAQSGGGARVAWAVFLDEEPAAARAYWLGRWDLLAGVLRARVHEAAPRARWDEVATFPPAEPVTAAAVARQGRADTAVVLVLRGLGAGAGSVEVTAWNRNKSGSATLAGLFPAAGQPGEAASPRAVQQFMDQDIRARTLVVRGTEVTDARGNALEAETVAELTGDRTLQDALEAAEGKRRLSRNLLFIALALPFGALILGPVGLVTLLPVGLAVAGVGLFLRSRVEDPWPLIVSAADGHNTRLRARTSLGK